MGRRKNREVGAWETEEVDIPEKSEEAAHILLGIRSCSKKLTAGSLHSEVRSFGAVMKLYPGVLVDTESSQPKVRGTLVPWVLNLGMSM
jgi:hypothetical protein